MEDMMSTFLKKISLDCLKVTCLGCLVFLLAAPAPAQEQSPKSQMPPAESAPQPGMQPKMAPPPAPAPVPQPEKAAEECFRGRQEKSLDMKKSTGKVGGQEIRSKKGQDEE
jgi:hypothetical protein